MILYEFLIGMHWHWMVGNILSAMVVVSGLIILSVIARRIFTRYVRTGCLSAPDPYFYDGEQRQQECITRVYGGNYNSYLDKELLDLILGILLLFIFAGCLILAWELVTPIGAIIVTAKYQRNRQKLVDKLTNKPTR